MADESATKDSSLADVEVIHDGNETEVTAIVVMVCEDEGEVVVAAIALREKWMQFLQRCQVLGE